jgi:hypothetical protein
VAAEDTELSPRRHAEDLRQTWQGRMLAHVNRGKIGMVVLSMFAHAFDDTDVMPVLLRAVFPGWSSIRPPFICSAAKIDKAGRLVADVVFHDTEAPRRDIEIFRTLGLFQGEMRRLADRMKLSDQERLEFFTVAKRWVVADRRLDPNMDPRDPDARRLTVH